MPVAVAGLVIIIGIAKSGRVSLVWWCALGKQNAFGLMPPCWCVMAVRMRTLALCVGATGWLTILPTMKRGEKLDQMVKFKGPTRVEDIGG
jgi:hypothetical protein